MWLSGGWLAIQGALTVGTIVAFVAYLGRLYGPASALAGVQVQIVSALAVFERIFEYLDMEPEGAEKPDAAVLQAVRGEIAFDDVQFSYTPERSALDGVSFRIAPGQMAAFVGPSGAGKTTITQLVPRFYDPQSGAVRVDGRDVRDVTLASLRENIGIVTQETYLFHDTIAMNLRYARPDATEARAAGGGTRGEHPRVRRLAPRRLPDGRRRARPQALRRRAPAPRDRARAA